MFIGGNGFIAAFVGGLAVGPTVESVGEQLIRFTEAEGQLLNLSVFFIFGVLVKVSVRGWSAVEAALKQEPVITPEGSTVLKRENPSYHPMLLDQPMSAHPASQP